MTTKEFKSIQKKPVWVFREFSFYTIPYTIGLISEVKEVSLGKFTAQVSLHAKYTNSIGWKTWIPPHRIWNFTSSDLDDMKILTDLDNIIQYKMGILYGIFEPKEL